VVAALQFNPIVIIKGHGTVAVGKTLQEAFLFTDLLEEAVRCQFYRERDPAGAATAAVEPTTPVGAAGESFEIFTPEHLRALVDAVNGDRQCRAQGAETALTTTLTLRQDDGNQAWTVRYVDGEITEYKQEENGAFMISGKTQWWDAVFRGRMDPFLATQQGKLKLERGDLAELARWYKPFQRAFAIWQTIPIQ
jgi:putative sterol carrier protein